MSVSKAAMAVTVKQAITGTLVRGLTRARYLEKGRPLSRAKDQVILEAVVVIPIAHDHVRQRTTADMTDAPAMLPTLSAKI